MTERSSTQDRIIDNFVSADEFARLAAVRRYDILDTPADGAFDRVTAIAARLFNVPISIVSIVDHDRIWFKSHHGLDVAEIGRAPGLCASAVLRDDPLIVPDARRDLHALANPLVAGEFGLRFYAGAPLRTADGFNLGTLCVIDKQPRQVTAQEVALLEDLASIVVDQLELRRSARSALEAEAALVAGAQNFRFLAESTSQKVFTADARGAVDYFNPAWTEFTGLSFEQIRSWGWTQFIHPDDVEENVRLWKRSIDTGEPFQFEHRFRRADGAWRWHLSRATAMRDGAGEIHKWIGSNTDIQGQKEREQAARQAVSHAEIMAQEIDHRVMNSLQFVAGLLGMQGRLADDERVAGELSIAAGRVAAIARVHRHFAQDEAAETVPCLAFLRRLSAELSNILEVRIDVGGTEATVPARRILPIGLLLNEFVTNAAKHGGGTIEVSFRISDGGCTLCVSDEGKGLPGDFQPQSPGNGLGMKVILGLAAQLDGRLEAGANPAGRGARFAVTFPAAP